MQATRINTRLPQLFRIRRTAPTYIVNHNMSLFPRLVQNEFAPMFRLMDDYANHVGRSSSLSSSLSNSLRSFTPKFDVKENKDSYELHGELPGIEQRNVTIEFSDPQTLNIKGRTEQSHEKGDRPATLTQGGGEQAKLTESEHGYHKPSVEDERQVQASVAIPEIEQEKNQKSKKTEDGFTYWISERSVGQFSRTFSFPTRVDQDNVKASLRDGVLSIVVPKAQAPVSKRINIE